jgi:hypothetical protein
MLETKPSRFASVALYEATARTTEYELALEMESGQASTPSEARRTEWWIDHNFWPGPREHKEIFEYRIGDLYYEDHVPIGYITDIRYNGKGDESLELEIMMSTRRDGSGDLLYRIVRL